MLLDRTVSVWRVTPGSSGTPGYNTSRVLSSVRCAIVPVSRSDLQTSYALQSTHLVWVEPWLILRKEDEVRWGRKLPDAFNNAGQEVYVINGRRRFTIGAQLVSYWATERE